MEDGMFKFFYRIGLFFMFFLVGKKSVIFDIILDSGEIFYLGVLFILCKIINFVVFLFK